jgi:hypothetical protein
MAIIQAKTGSQYIFATRSWNDPNTWQGGIVPTSSDIVYIAGQNLGNTISTFYAGINYLANRQGASRFNYGLTYWEGKTLLTPTNGITGSVDPSGSLFAYTSTGELIKIDYSGTFQSTVSTILPEYPTGIRSALLNASVDTSFSPWTSQYYPGTGSDGYSGFIHGQSTFFTTPVGVIQLTGSETASFDTLYIHSGSKLHLSDNAQLNIHGKIYLQRGELKTSGSCMINFKRIYSGSAGAVTTNPDDNAIQFISVLNDAGSKFSMIGPEVRTNTTLSLSASIGDYFINVGSETGFAEGDHIFVGEEDIIPFEVTGSPYWSPTQNSGKLSSTDEAFIVVATGSNKLYISRVAALDAPVEFTGSSTQILTSTPPPLIYNVSNDGNNAYIIDSGSESSSNPALTLEKGRTYTFNISAIGHPFWIKTALTTGDTTDIYVTDGLTNNGTSNGTITFIVPEDAPATLYYICQVHGIMANTITIAENSDEFTYVTNELIVDDERYQVGDKIIVNGQTASVTNVEDYTYVLKDYDFSGSMTQNDLEQQFFIDAKDRQYDFNPYVADWKIIPGKGVYNDSSRQININEGPSAQGSYVNPARLFARDIYERNTKVEVWVNNNYLVEDESIFKNTYQNQFWSQSTVYIFAQVDPTRRLHGYYYQDFSSYLEIGLDRSKSTSPLSPFFTFKPQRGRNVTSPSIQLAKVDPNYLYNTHKYTLEYYKGEYKIYLDDELIQTHGDITLGTTKGLVGLGKVPDTIGPFRSWTVFPRMKVSVTKQKLTLDTSVTGVLPGHKVYQSGIESTHAIGNKVIKLQSFITDPLDFDNLVFAHRGFKNFANDGKHPTLRYFFDNIESDITNKRLDRITTDISIGTYLPYILGQANTYFSNGIVFATPSNRITSPPFAAIFDLGESKNFNTVGWADAFGGASSYNLDIKYTTPIQISGSNDLENWTGITSSVDTRDSLTWNYFRDFTFSTQTFRYVLIKVPVNNRNLTWRVWGFRILNNTSNRIRVNNTSDFEVGDTVAIYNHATAWSDHNPYGYTSNIYPYIQAGSGSENVIGDLKGREYKILGKDGNTITLDRSFRHGYLMKGDSVVKINRASEIRGSYESGSWSTGRLLVQQHAVRTLNSSEGANDTELTLTNVGLRNFSNMFPQYSANTSRYPIYWNNSEGPSKTVRFQGISYYGGPPDNYSPYIYSVSNYHIRHSNLGLFAGTLGLSYQSRVQDNTTAHVSYWRKSLPRISTGNIGNISSNYYHSHEKLIQSYNWIYNGDLGFGAGNLVAGYSNARTTPQRHLVVRRNINFGQRFSQTYQPSSPSSTPSTLVNHEGVINFENNLTYGASAMQSGLFSNQGTNQSPLRYIKNILVNTQYMHLVHNSVYTGNPLFEASSIESAFGYNYRLGAPVIKFKNYNNWGVDIFRTPGYLVHRKHTEDYYRYYPFYVEDSIDPENAFRRQYGLGNMSSFFKARISSLSSSPSTFTVNFTYRVDASIKYSSFVGGFGDLSGSFADAITTLEDTDMNVRSQYPIQLSQFYQNIRSTKKSGYFYLVAIKDEQMLHFEALPPNTDFTQITRTFTLDGEGELEVLLAGTSIFGFYDFKGVTSVLETADPENVILRQNTFDLNDIFENDESNNLPRYKHQIKDLSKSGKFRLKSARLS